MKHFESSTDSCLNAQFFSACVLFWALFGPSTSFLESCLSNQILTTTFDSLILIASWSNGSSNPGGGTSHRSRQNHLQVLIVNRHRRHLHGFPNSFPQNVNGFLHGYPHLWSSTVHLVRPTADWFILLIIILDPNSRSWTTLSSHEIMPEKRFFIGGGRYVVLWTFCPLCLVVWHWTEKT